MAEWERSAAVTEWFKVRTLLVSLVWFEFLQFQVAWASGLFAPSDSVPKDTSATAIGLPSRLSVLQVLSLLCIKMF